MTPQIVWTFAGAVLPGAVFIYLVLRLTKRVFPVLRRQPYSRYMPVAAFVLGVVLGMIPGIARFAVDLAGGSNVHVGWWAGVFIGGLSGLLAPSVYAWWHKAIAPQKDA